MCENSLFIIRTLLQFFSKKNIFTNSYKSYPMFHFIIQKLLTFKKQI